MSRALFGHAAKRPESFAVRFRFNGKPKKLTLKAGISLAAARAAAAAALHEVEQGSDPSATKRRDKQVQQSAAANTFRAIAELYLDREGRKKESERLRSLKYQRTLLERLVFPTLGNTPIGKIKRGTVIDLLDKIEDGNLVDPDGNRIRGGPVMAHSTLAVIRKLLNWYAVRDEDFRSPIVRGMGRIRPEERARKRVLSDDELRAVWKAAGERTDPFAALIKFLLLTAARRNEAGGLTWSEIKGQEWLLPATRNKVKIDFIRPLSVAALTVLKAQPQIKAAPTCLPTARGKSFLPTRETRKRSTRPAALPLGPCTTCAARRARY